MAVLIGAWNLEPGPAATATPPTAAPQQASAPPPKKRVINHSLRELAARASRVRAH